MAGAVHSPSKMHSKKPVWNKDKYVGQKLPFTPLQIETIARSTAPSFALTPTTKIAFVHLDFAAHHRWFVADNFLMNSLATIVKKRIAVLRFTPANSAAERAVEPATS